MPVNFKFRKVIVMLASNRCDFGPDWVNSSDLATVSNNTLMAVDNPTAKERKKMGRTAAVLQQSQAQNAGS